MTTGPAPVRTPLPSALEGRTAVLLGGTSGIGLAASEMLAAQGARVILAGRDRTRLDAAVAKVAAASTAEVRGVIADATDEDSLRTVFEGAGSLDHVFVTAGAPSGLGPITEVPSETMQAALQTPAWTAAAVARTAVPHLPPGGSITFSSGVLVPRPRPNMSATIASAGAVETLTRALAVELAPARIRVNAIRFGAMDTPLLRANFGAPAGPEGDPAINEAGRSLPLGRFGTPEEAASAALFLMANTYTTGTVLSVDGAQSLL